MTKHPKWIEERMMESAYQYARRNDTSMGEYMDGVRETLDLIHEIGVVEALKNLYEIPRVGAALDEAEKALKKWENGL